MYEKRSVIHIEFKVPHSILHYTSGLLRQRLKSLIVIKKI